jgi:Mor family transcriptional regulator
MSKINLDRGQIAVDDIRDQAVAAIQAKLANLGLKAPELCKRYKISEIDLRGIITGQGQVPLARILMFAANLGYDLQLVVSE